MLISLDTQKKRIKASIHWKEIWEHVNEFEQSLGGKKYKKIVVDFKVYLSIERADGELMDRLEILENSCLRLSHRATQAR